MSEQDSRWAEIITYTYHIHRIATEASHVQITKENYYDLYNMAVCLLKAVDSLDPDKMHNMQQQRKTNDFDLAPQLSVGGPGTQISQMSATSPPAITHSVNVPAELDQILSARKSFDYYFNRSSMDSNMQVKYPTEVPLFYNSQPVPANFMNAVLPTGYPAMPMTSIGAMPKAPDPQKQSKNFTGEVFFDEQQSGNEDQSRRPKREQRRRRTVYSSRRNLHCHMCGVTETPEWRRGPAGDHTLCNACGLHYAKSLKKQRKEREGRKHSIEMLLNQSNPPNPNTAEPT